MKTIKVTINIDDDNTEITISRGGVDAMSIVGYLELAKDSIINGNIKI